MGGEARGVGGWDARLAGCTHCGYSTALTETQEGSIGVLIRKKESHVPSAPDFDLTANSFDSIYRHTRSVTKRTKEESTN